MTIDRILCLIIGFIFGVNATFIFIGMMIGRRREDNETK